MRALSAVVTTRPGRIRRCSVPGSLSAGVLSSLAAGSNSAGVSRAGRLLSRHLEPEIANARVVGITLTPGRGPGVENGGDGQEHGARDSCSQPRQPPAGRVPDRAPKKPFGSVDAHGEPLGVDVDRIDVNGGGPDREGEQQRPGAQRRQYGTTATNDLAGEQRHGDGKRHHVAALSRIRCAA